MDALYNNAPHFPPDKVDEYEAAILGYLCGHLSEGQAARECDTSRLELRTIGQRLSGADKREREPAGR